MISRLSTISFTLLFVVSIAINKPAFAVDGPKDAAALGVTAALITVSAYSGWNWYYENDPKTIANRLARLSGEDSLAQWYIENVKGITVIGGAISLVMMRKFCTKVGIGPIDRALGLE